MPCAPSFMVQQGLPVAVRAKSVNCPLVQQNHAAGFGRLQRDKHQTPLCSVVAGHAVWLVALNILKYLQALGSGERDTSRGPICHAGKF